MKRHIKIFSLFLLLLAVYINAYAAPDDWNVERKKTISKSYSLSDRSRVSVKNSFGNVNVLNWSKDEVKVDITVTVKASTDEAATALLDAITIEESGGSTVSFETRIRSGNGRSSGRNKSSSMQIDYVIYLPAATTLKVMNSFGNTFIPDRNGSTELSQAYGNLTTGSLTNIDRLSVEFGRLAAKELENTKVFVKFSEVEISKLSGNFDGNFQFCSKPTIGFTTAIRNITIETKYSDLTIHIPRSFDANFDIVTNFGRVTNNSDLKLVDRDGGKMTETKYSASAPKADRKVSIRSEFGKIQLK
ncbi:hypothetical protein [Niabella beijingensis]|uniref:hypothetical protein n=1 Tax=Niabella beijingensis TaxID=2872700 RepID=UPI001CBBC004|nr:hypothetical protein [Niabella beijingensis]MBZ4188160.1 hypothetical protein [Niabella beijingensis]